MIPYFNNISRAINNVDPSGLMTPIILFVISFILLSFERMAILSASDGEYFRISFLSIPYQIGINKEWPVDICFCNKPSNSQLVHSFAKKFLLSTIMPNLDFNNPLSIDCLRLSPGFNENSSYQTSMLFSFNEIAKGLTKSSLSSLAWLINTSYNIWYNSSKL